MINGLYIFNTEYELIIKRAYYKTAGIDKVTEALKSGVKIVEISDETVVHSCFEDIIVCFVVSDENEMYVLELVLLLADAVERMLGCLNNRLLTYHFRDAYTLVDSFILNGKVVCVDVSDILASVGARFTLEN